MDLFKKVSAGEVWTVEETLDLTFLEIAPGAEIKAPEGKSVTLSCDGVELDIAPGYYQGALTLTVTDDIDVQYKGLEHKYRTGICVIDGKYVPEKSVAAAVTGGTVGDGEASGFTILSDGEEFGGMYFSGGGDYTVKGAKIDLVGNGGNDFYGFGAGICAHGSGNIRILDSQISTRGAARGAVFVGDDTRVLLENCQITSRDGVLPPEYVDNVKLGQMKAVPWMLGLRGNCRATNLCQNGEVTYKNCRITAGGWGVLSVDDLVKGKLHIVDSTVEITGPSGYGAFGIGECETLFDHATVKVPDYGLNSGSPEARAIFRNGTVVESGRFVANCGGCGGVTVDSTCTLRGDEAVFNLKNGATVLDIDGAKLESAGGVILQMVDNDDPFNCGGYFIDPPGEDVKDPDWDLTACTPGVDVICNFSNMTLEGDFYNGSSNLVGDTGPKPAGNLFMPTAKDGTQQELPKEAVVVKKKMGARNLILNLKAMDVTGRITASKSRHFVEKITKENCREINHFRHVPQPAVNNGVILSAIGSLRQVRFCDVEPLPDRKCGVGYGKILALDETVELTGAGGVICSDADNNINLHIHISMSDKNGKAYGGHLVEGSIVLMTADIVLGEIEGISMLREYDEDMDVYLLNPKQL